MLSGRLYCVVLLPVLLFAVACGPSPRSRVAATLDEVETYINERPDSALAVLRILDSTATYRGPAQRARASLLHTMALDKSYEDITAPGLLDDAVKWYSHQGTPDQKMKTLYYRGRIFQDKEDLNSAAVAYAQAESYADQAEDRHAVGLMYLAFGSVYNRVFNTQQERKYKEKGVQVLKDAGDPLYDKAVGELALVYHSMHEWAVADSLYQKALTCATDYPEAMRLYLSNYARMLLLQPEPNPSKAISLLDRRQKEYHTALSAQDAGAYAYASELLGKRGVADGILRQLNSLPEEKRQIAYFWMARIALHRGDYKSAYENLNKTMALEREDIAFSLSDSVTRALQEYYDSLAEKERRSRIQVMWMALSAILILVVIVLLIKMRKAAIESERDRLYEIQAALVKDMRDLEAQFEELSSAYAQTEEESSKKAKQEGREAEISRKLDEAQERFRRERLSRFRQMGRLGSTVWQMDKKRIDADLAWKELKEQLGYIHQIQHGGTELIRRLDQELDGAISRMRQDLGLRGKPKEVLFLCCCILDMDPVFVSDIMGISIDNVYKKKSRYRAKVEALGCNEYILLLGR